MIKRDLFKNTLKILTLSFVTALTLTGCSINIKVPDMTDISTEVQTAIDYSIYEIADMVDKTDLTDESEVTKMAENINESFQSEYYDFEKATLVRVVDGDTIVVNIDGEDVTVRLIGINTPESVAPESYLDRTGKMNTAEGINASEYTKTLLEDVDVVYLEKDVSETDKYDRLLRYVWLEIPEDNCDIGEIATKMLNGILVADHIAEVTPYKPDVAHNEDFEYIYENWSDFDR